MRRLVLSMAVGLLMALVVVPSARAQESPLVWEVVGHPVDEFDLWPDTFDILVTDTAAYANGGEGFFVIRPGDSDFADEPWTLLRQGLPLTGVYATSTGVLFAITRGMLRSTDGGVSWGDYIDDVVAALELPSGVLLAAEVSCCGIARSTNDGATWTLINLDDLLVPQTLGYAPPSAARSEGVAVALGRDGAAYSTDEGLTWTPSNLIDPFAYFGETAIYSAYHDSLFAGINGDPSPDAPPGTPGSGLVWASVDGATWEYRGRLPTSSDNPVQLVAGEDGVLWGLVPGRIDPPVYSSSDGGRTWVDRGVVVGTPLVGNPLRVQRLRMDSAGRLWLGATRGADPNTATGAVLRTAAPVTVAIEDGSGKPGEVALGVAYPNPANGSVTVPLTLDAAAEVSVVVYDVLERQVAVLADGRVEAGRRTFTLDGGVLPAGLYVVRATVRTDGGAVQAFSQRVSIVR